VYTVTRLGRLHLQTVVGRAYIQGGIPYYIPRVGREPPIPSPTVKREKRRSERLSGPYETGN